MGAPLSMARDAGSCRNRRADTTVHIHCLGPWQGICGGAVDDLRAHFRCQLTERGFVVVYQHLLFFTLRA